MALKSRELVDTKSNLKNIIRTNQSEREFITAYGPKLRTVHESVDPGLTKQSFKDECDINRIMDRYQVTGVLPENLMVGNPQYVDVTGVEYQEAMLKVADAQSLFNRLPAAIRARFSNNPSAFLAFAENPDNRPELIKMGLGRPGVEPAPQPAPPPPLRALQRPEMAGNRVFPVYLRRRPE